MLMSPNQDETAAHGCNSTGNLAVRMRKVQGQTAFSFPDPPFLLVTWLATCFRRKEKKRGALGTRMAKPRRCVVWPIAFSWLILLIINNTPPNLYSGDSSIKGHFCLSRGCPLIGGSPYPEFKLVKAIWQTFRIKSAWSNTIVCLESHWQIKYTV